MEYETRTYFEENDADDVKGFTIIGRDDDTGEYHIAEKWVRSEDDSTWVQYWVSEAKLMSRVNSGACSPKAELSDEQYETVCDKVGLDETGVAQATA